MLGNLMLNVLLLCQKLLMLMMLIALDQKTGYVVLQGLQLYLEKADLTGLFPDDLLLLHRETLNEQPLLLESLLALLSHFQTVTAVRCCVLFAIVYSDNCSCFVVNRHHFRFRQFRAIFRN